ncbi:AAA family ATPase [Bacillus timonensis]|nr:AAA family ATPase [Bacillus timonensis]
MSVEKHPDYQQEKENLDFTNNYMKIVIQASESDEASFKDNLKHALEGIDFKDSSFSYMNMLTNSNLLRRTYDELKKLKKIEGKPYFARIDFRGDGTDSEEVLYFGKASLFDKETQQPIIVDWRSPIANLYYDGRLGDVSYEAEGQEYKGYLSLKRQYVIDKGKLEEIRDIDLTTNDELLQKSLSASASNRLTDIVSTIQEEQNKVIRADLNKPIIVQGAAGSGKTTIALHRIAYFIYTYSEYFSPDQLMILAPNRLFLDYISEVLPELGVDRILQTTYVEYVKDCVGKKLKITNPNEKLIGFIDGKFENPELIRWISSFKGSLAFRDIIHLYLEDILESLLPKEDFYLSKFKLYSAKKLRKLMVEEYKYLPFYARKDKIKRVLQNHVRVEKEAIIQKVTNFYEAKLEKALYSNSDKETRKKYISKALDKREEMVDGIKREARTCVQRYIKKLPKHDLFDYYQNLVSNKEVFEKYARGVMNDKQLDAFCRYQLKLRDNKVYELEDLAPLLYMQGRLYGIEKDLKVRNVVIDEAQDYSYFQFFALKSVLETDMFTIVGDLAQGIHSYRGMNDWGIVQSEIFPRSTYKTLQKSYRTTVEIMNTANDLLSLLNLQLPLVEPVVRHGERPYFKKIQNSMKDTVAFIASDIRELYQSGIKSIAIIGKTDKECEKLTVAFLKYSPELSVQPLKENEEINHEKVVIVSSHLSKGLEFDAVIICSIDEVYQLNEIDIKLLYVSMTRPLHKLLLYGKSPNSFLLNHIHNELVMSEDIE